MPSFYPLSCLRYFDSAIRDSIIHYHWHVPKTVQTPHIRQRQTFGERWTPCVVRFDPIPFWATIQQGQHRMLYLHSRVNGYFIMFIHPTCIFSIVFSPVSFILAGLRLFEFPVLTLLRYFKSLPAIYPYQRIFDNQRTPYVVHVNSEPIFIVIVKSMLIQLYANSPLLQIIVDQAFQLGFLSHPSSYTSPLAPSYCSAKDSSL
ncbi:hypothetical protein F8M41_004548 [Gigaspora margarita]|uniref:Uncharacterized protein n=1 Tax=Gigaspora margarita TaxID=4874 RepID=A0A8H3XB32_GIGMA|nr:hypothetical protein F8M41_004548 [Gigaspora margarita]